ncbi:hypothetical protein B0H14DRAFT_2627059 [Mycena olivaceomarginata]|nr:hypothetical protein B0H14DRAFT_2627059 [Mycena olivaceomarginata]
MLLPGPTEAPRAASVSERQCGASWNPEVLDRKIMANVPTAHHTPKLGNCLAGTNIGDRRQHRRPSFCHLPIHSTWSFAAARRFLISRVSRVKSAINMELWLSLVPTKAKLRILKGGIKNAGRARCNARDVSSSLIMPIIGVWYPWNVIGKGENAHRQSLFLLVPLKLKSPHLLQIALDQNLFGTLTIFLLPTHCPFTHVNPDEILAIPFCPLMSSNLLSVFARQIAAGSHQWRAKAAHHAWLWSPA